MHVDSLVRPIEVVSAADPALDMGRADRIAYAESRDPALIRELPGEKAIRFVCRPLTASELVAVCSRAGAEGKALFAFAFAVTEIVHADLTGPAEGRRILPTRLVEHGRPRIWDDPEIDALQEMLGFALISEIGAFAFERAWLRKKKGSGHQRALRPFTVPQSLLEELEWIERLRAAHQPTTPEETPRT